MRDNNGKVLKFLKEEKVNIAMLKIAQNMFDSDKVDISPKIKA